MEVSALRPHCPLCRRSFSRPFSLFSFLPSPSLQRFTLLSFSLFHLKVHVFRCLHLAHLFNIFKFCIFYNWVFFFFLKKLMSFYHTVSYVDCVFQSNGSQCLVVLRWFVRLTLALTLIVLFFVSLITNLLITEPEMDYQGCHPHMGLAFSFLSAALFVIVEIRDIKCVFFFFYHSCLQMELFLGQYMAG